MTGPDIADTTHDRDPGSPDGERRWLRLGTTLRPTWQRLLLIQFVSVIVVVGGLRYLWWRSATLDGTGWFGALFYLAEVIGYILVSWTAMLVIRTRRRLDGPPCPPSGTLDVYVTVCGEPLAMLEATLRAALAITYSHRTYVLNDGRVAGKPGWWEVDALAARYGVTCLTRRSGTRGKAGNLNHALPLTTGEYIATIDADHVAEPGLAHHTLGYLKDPDVAFVTTAQAFALDRADLLNNAEPIFYHWIQPAKDADGCAFSCGNASVYRRSALDEIGGFSEWNLVEDVHTSYLLHARGWDSAYHPHPVTLGVAPQTAAVYLTQRLRWAMDSLRLLFFDCPLRRRGLSWRRRLHYLQTTGFYVLASFQVVLLLAPPLYVLWGISVAEGFTAADYVHYGAPYLLAILALLLLTCGLRGAVGTLQGASFAWPVFGLAVLRTLAGLLPSTDPTAKGRSQPRFSILLVPVLCCFAAQVVALGWGLTHPLDDNGVAMFWVGLQAFLLAGPVSAVSSSAVVRRGVRLATRTAVISLTVVAIAVATLPLPISAPRTLVVAGSEATALGADMERRRLEPPVEGAYLGVMTNEPPTVPHALRPRTEGSESSDAPQIVHWFQQWRSGEIRFRTDWLETVAAAGAVPMITWEPWAKPDGSYRDPEQPGTQLSRIAGGAYDPFIRAWAQGAAAYGRPLLLRPMHEMNAWWYPWSVDVNGNTADDYVAAWRHIHELFELAGADNVAWVWSVNELAGTRYHNEELTASYPGDDYVDWVGMTGFNWGSSRQWSRWRTHNAIYADTYDRLVAFGKPIMIPEIATVDGDGRGAVWIDETLDGLRRDYPLVKAVVWFNDRYAPTVDFTLDGTRVARLRAATRDPYWSTPVRVARIDGLVTSR